MIKRLTTKMRRTKTVDSSSLDMYSKKGWQLIAMYQEAAAEVTYVTVQCGGQGANGANCQHGYSYNHTEQEQVVTQGSSTHFLIGLPENDTVVEIAEQLEEALTRANTEENARKVSEKDGKDKDTAIKAWERTSKSLEAVIEELRAGRQAMRDQLDKGENALSDEREKVKKLKDELARRVTG